jgi:hypothetical protein
MEPVSQVRVPVLDANLGSQIGGAAPSHSVVYKSGKRTAVEREYSGTQVSWQRRSRTWATPRRLTPLPTPPKMAGSFVGPNFLS